MLSLCRAAFVPWTYLLSLGRGFHEFEEPCFDARVGYLLLDRRSFDSMLLAEFFERIGIRIHNGDKEILIADRTQIAATQCVSVASCE